MVTCDINLFSDILTNIDRHSVVVVIAICLGNGALYYFGQWRLVSCAAKRCLGQRFLPSLRTHLRRPNTTAKGGIIEYITATFATKVAYIFYAGLLASLLVYYFLCAPSPFYVCL